MSLQLLSKGRAGPMRGTRLTERLMESRHCVMVSMGLQTMLPDSTTSRDNAIADQTQQSPKRMKMFGRHNATVHITGSQLMVPHLSENVWADKIHEIPKHIKMFGSCIRTVTITDCA